MTEFFVQNLDMLVCWLNCAKTTESDLKKAFIVSLKELLKPPKDAADKEKVNELVRRLFSNIMSPTKMPDLGSEF